MNPPRVHTIQTGTLVGNETFMRGERWSSLLAARRDCEFPAHCFVIETAEAHTLIDTGIAPGVRSPRPLVQRRFVPNPLPTGGIGDALREAGVDPADVRRVVLTHLDWDHAGGLDQFPHAEFLVHRPEWEFARTLAGRVRYEPNLWPQGFDPTVYDLDPGPYGPFPSSLAIATDPTVVVVPLPGHTIGQVGVILELDRFRVLFCGDHVLRQDWFRDDYRAGRLVGLGIWNRRHAVETSRRVAALLAEAPTVLVPSHDSDAPARLAALEATEAPEAVAGARVE